MSTNPLGVHALVFSGGTTPAEVTTIIGEAKAAGYFKADPFIIRRFLTGALSWSTTWFRPEGPMSLDQLAHEALSLVIKDS